MNQFCKNFLVKTHILRSISLLNKTNNVRNFVNISSILNSKINEHGPIRFYVSSSKPITSNNVRLNRKLDNSNFNSKFDRFQNDRQSSIEADFEDAEPVELTGKSNYAEKVTSDFAKFDLPKELLDRLNQLGYDKPFEIQEATLKYTLEGRDVVGKAFTGSGKTLAFSIPIISRIMKSENKSSKYPKCLVLAPTRELCLQLQKSIQELAPSLKCLPILGGTGYEEQIRQLSGKVDIVCATPGRLKDLIQRKNFVTDNIEIICLDEADQLLQKSFIEQIEDVIEISNKKQMLMFSATINKEVVQLVNRYMNEPVMVDLTKGQKHKLPTNIEHYHVRAPSFANVELIKNYIDEFESERCIIFSNTKSYATKISNELLYKNRIRTDFLHSDISQAKRQKILDKFRKGHLKTLVATDVAARGIDIPEVDLVIQVGAPSQGIDFYIHRSGRTGRAGRVGRSILIANNYNDQNVVKDLSRIIKFKQLTAPRFEKPVRENLDDYEDDEEPSFNKRPYRARYNSNEDDPMSINNFESNRFSKYNQTKSFKRNSYRFENNRPRYNSEPSNNRDEL